MAARTVRQEKNVEIEKSVCHPVDAIRDRADGRRFLPRAQ
jgi:hypothetical protein